MSWDRSYPIAMTVGALSAWMSYSISSGLEDQKLLRDAADSLAGVTGTLAGFLLTCISLVIGLSESHPLSELKKNGSLRRLVRRSGWSVVFLIAASLAASVTRLATTKSEWLLILANCTAFLTVVGVVLLISSGREYMRVFGFLSRPRK